MYVFSCFALTNVGRILVDDCDMFGRAGGRGYETYGIDPVRGAIVVVRPDGYVGMVSPLEDVGELDSYFGGFM